MEGLVDSIRALRPAITDILSTSGTVGASLGVIHHGEIIYTSGYGQRDVQRNLPMDDETVVSLFSLTKGMTGSAFGVLVDEKKVTWDSPYISIMPDFKHQDEVVQQNTTIRDLLAQRVGLAQYNALFMQDFGKLYLAKDQTLTTASTLPLTAGFRQKFQYNNWNYALAALAVKPLSGLSLGEFLVKHFFEPLGMARTSVVRPSSGSENVSEGYMALANGSSSLTERPFVGDDQIVFGAMGVNSCVKDLLVYYQAMMSAGANQLDTGSTSTKGSPFRRVKECWTAQVPVTEKSWQERSYAMGLWRIQMPAAIQNGSPNTQLCDMPVVAKGSRTQLVLCHGGTSAASQNWVYMIPQTQTAVVVLTNTMANCDASQFIASLVMEAIVDSPEKNDYVTLAKTASKRGIEKWEELHQVVDKEQIHGTQPKSSDTYVGKYWNHVGNWFMEIYLDGGILKLAFQGDRSTSHPLRHYHYDTFTWLLTQDESAAFGRFPYTTKGQWMVNFTGEGDQIVGLRWNQNGIREGEYFHKGEYCLALKTSL